MVNTNNYLLERKSVSSEANERSQNDGIKVSATKDNSDQNVNLDAQREETQADSQIPPQPSMAPYPGWNVNPQVGPFYQGHGMPDYFWEHMYQSPATFSAPPFETMRDPYGFMTAPYRTMREQYEEMPYRMMIDPYEVAPYEMMRSDERFIVAPGFGWGWGWGFPFWGWGRPGWGWGRPGWGGRPGWHR